MADSPLPDGRRYLYAEFTANDATAAARVEELLGSLALAVRAEPANLVFDAYRKAEDPTSFFVYEIYEDEAAFQFHLDQEHGRVFNAELTGLVRGGASQLTWLDPVSQDP